MTTAADHQHTDQCCDRNRIGARFDFEDQEDRADNGRIDQCHERDHGAGSSLARCCASFEDPPPGGCRNAHTNAIGHKVAQRC